LPRRNIGKKLQVNYDINNYIISLLSTVRKVNIAVTNDLMNFLIYIYICFSCRFLQGPETDRGTVKKIRDAIDNQTEVTVQLINYTKSGTYSSHAPMFL
jgi:hypothetical protein